MRTLQAGVAVTVLATMLVSAAAVVAPLDDESANENGAAASSDGGAAESSDDGALLAGPKVEDAPEDADNPAFVGEDRLRQTIEVPARQWFDVLREVELRDEQREQVVAIASEYEKAMREFRRENAQVLRDLEERIAKTRETGEFDPSLREQFREIQSGAPEAKEYQERIWALLDAAQQETFKAKLEEVRKQIAERRARERDGRLDTMRRGGGDGGEGMGQGTMDGRSDDDVMAPRSGGAGPRGAMERGRGGWRAAPGSGLDAMSQRRFEFLMSKRSKSAVARDGALERLRERRGANRGQPMD